MTKSEFTATLAQRCGVSIQEGEKIVNAFLDSVEDGLCGDGRVPLPGFGILEVRDMAARKGRNPGTGEEIDIAARKVLKFKMATELKQRLNRPD